MMMDRIRAAAVALLAAAPCATMGATTVHVTMNGRMSVNTLPNGVFSGIPVGSSASMEFDVRLPGNPEVPGQFETYEIVGETFLITVGGASVGLSQGLIDGPAQAYVLIGNDFPVTDSIRIENLDPTGQFPGLEGFLTPLDTALYTLEFVLRDNTGTVFDSTDITQLPPSMTQANFPSDSFWGIINFQGGEANFTLSGLTLDIGDPCPCEHDGLPGVNALDLLSYLDAWFPQTLDAEVDCVLGITVLDLLQFLECWYESDTLDCE